MKTIQESKHSYKEKVQSLLTKKIKDKSVVSVPTDFIDLGAKDEFVVTSSVVAVRRGKSWLKTLLSFLILGAFSLVSMSMLANRTKLAVTESLNPQIVSKFVVVRENLRPSIPVFGRVEAGAKYVVAATRPSNVMTVHVKEGDRVLKGDILVSLNAHEAKIKEAESKVALAKAEATLATARQELGGHRARLELSAQLLALLEKRLIRLQPLKLDNLVEKAPLEETEAELIRQRIEVNSIKTAIQNKSADIVQLESNVELMSLGLERAVFELEQMSIYSSVDGQISGVFTAAGNYVGAGSALMELQDNTSLQIRTQIPVKHIDALASVGLTPAALDAFFISNSDKVWLENPRALVSLNEGESGVPVLFDVPQEASKISLRQVVSMELLLPEVTDVISVPFDAVYDDQEVFVIHAGRLKRAPIKMVGEHLNNGIGRHLLIQSEVLNEGDQILSERLAYPQDGMHVKLR